MTTDAADDALQPRPPMTARDLLEQRSRRFGCRVFFELWFGALGVIIVGGILERHFGACGSIAGACIAIVGLAAFLWAIDRHSRRLACPYCGTRLAGFELTRPYDLSGRDGGHGERAVAKIRFLPCCRAPIDAELPTLQGCDDDA